MRTHWATDLALGGLSGLAASWIMEQVQTLGSDSSSDDSNASESSDTEARASGEHEQHEQQEEAERTSEERHQTESSDPATVQAAQTAAALVGKRIPEERKNLAGELVHFGYGALWGGLYALAVPRRTNPILSGLAFGAGLWLVSDEILVPLLGWAKWAPEYPPSVHAKALAAHLTYGVSTAAAVSAIRAGMKEGLLERLELR